jgi:hypothetical protein
MSHVAAGPAFDSAADLADSAEQRFDRVCAAEELSEVAGQTQPDDRQCFFQAFFEAAGRVAINGMQSRDGFVEHPSRVFVMRLSVSVVDATTSLAPVRLREITFHVAKLMKLAALNDGIVSEDGLHGGSQSLRSIKTEQRRLSRIDAAIAQAAQQIFDDFRVLGFALMQSQHVLSTGIIDSQSDHHYLAAEGYTINEYRGESHVVEAALIEALQLLSGSPHEVLTDGTILPAEARASRFHHRFVVATRNAAHHFRERRVRHAIGRLQRRVHIQVDFHAADTANSGAANGDLLAAENHITRLASMPTVFAIRITGILPAAEPHDILFEKMSGNLNAHLNGKPLQRCVQQPTKFVRIRDSKSIHRKQRIRRFRRVRSA